MQIYAVGLLAHKISSQLSSAPQAEQVRKIYDRQLRDDRDSGEQCMYLAVVPASGEVRPSNNPVMKFIIEEGLQAWPQIPKRLCWTARCEK